MNEVMSDDVPSRTRERHARDATDLYEVLEVSPHASTQVIQAAYRALARSYHPDANQGNGAEDSDRMRRLNAAYSVLSDARRRAEYDLERARTRRHQRALGTQGVNTLPLTANLVPIGSRQVPSRTRSTISDDRSPTIRAGTLLVLMVVAAVTLLALVLVLNGLAVTDELPINARPTSHVMER